LRRTMLLFVVIAVALVLGSSAALAVSKTGTSGNDTLKGTRGKDTLSGGGGNDRINGLGARDRLYGDSGNDRVVGRNGPDQVFGGQGKDRVFGGSDNDFLNTLDERIDPVINCGSGNFDEAYVDFEEFDLVSENCEHVFGAAFERQEAEGVTPESLTPKEANSASLRRLR
jgi:RTX calcium-binding nonapeptide repeat (4 copies)